MYQIFVYWSFINNKYALWIFRTNKKTVEKSSIKVLLFDWIHYTGLINDFKHTWTRETKLVYQKTMDIVVGAFRRYSFSESNTSGPTCVQLSEETAQCSP